MTASRSPAGTSDLTGTTAIVTGASRGIGRAIALELAGAGADLLLHTRAREADAQAAAEQIRQLGRRADVLVFDLSDSQNCQRLVHAAWQWSEQIAVWVNNAGADVLTGSNSAWSFEQKLTQLWKVDVRGTILVSRLAGERMRNSSTRPGDSVILNMGWDQADFGMAGDSGEMFAAVKGAIMSFSRSLARSLAPQVRVNCLAPGWIQTDWGSGTTEYWHRRARQESLMARWGTPKDVAATARFLVSPAANFITGQVVAVNGGYRGSVE